MDELGNSVHVAKTISYEFYWIAIAARCKKDFTPLVRRHLSCQFKGSRRKFNWEYCR